MEIMAQLHREEPSSGHSAHSLQEEMERLRQEVISLLGEKEQLEIVNRTYQEKIEDLKYHNGELKNLNQKITQLHTRELDMLQREAAIPDKQRELGDRERERALREKETLAREKEVLGKQLQEVAKVAEEMEQYYVAEIRKKNELIRSRD
jgi:uncharacterized protein (DUF3084 family)